MFDPGGSTGRPRTCPFLGGRRALLGGGFVWDVAMVSEAGAFLFSEGLQHKFPREGQAIWYTVRYCGISLFPRSQKIATGSRDGTRLWNVQGLNG